MNLLNTVFLAVSFLMLATLAPMKLCDDCKDFEASLNVLLSPRVVKLAKRRAAIIGVAHLVPLDFFLIRDHLFHGLSDERVEICKHETREVLDFRADHGSLSMNGLLSFEKQVTNAEVEEKSSGIATKGQNPILNKENMNHVSRHIN